MKKGQTVRRVAVIGAGMMGHGIGQMFAQAGVDVALFDSEEKVLRRAVPRIRKSLDVFTKRGLIRKRK